MDRSVMSCSLCCAVVTCEIQLFPSYFCLRRRPTEIILFQRVKTCMKLFHNYFRGLLQLMSIFQHAQCYQSNFEVISAAKIILFQLQMRLHVK